MKTIRIKTLAVLVFVLTLGAGVVAGLLAATALGGGGRAGRGRVIRRWATNWL